MHGRSQRAAYLLRSNIDDWSDHQLWKAYIQLTQAEAAFRMDQPGAVSRAVQRRTHQVLPRQPLVGLRQLSPFFRPLIPY
jgi:hypothetical protein